MSRYGKSPIPVPKGVEIKKNADRIVVKGPKGSLEIPSEKGIDVKIDGEIAYISVDENSKIENAMHGLYRSLVNNMVIGVHKGYEKRLTLIGVGYRAAVTGNYLDLQLGFSHPSKVQIPKGITVTVDKSTLIIIQGIDKQLVGQFAATIRGVRPPEPYKGKGVRYEKEYVRKKAGKAAKGKTA